MSVAVIGGGWAGIAAAVELTAAGVPVTLFEAGRVLGGRARAVDSDERRLDNGQHILLGAYRETLALMRHVGADPERLLDRRPLQVVADTGFRLALPRWPAPFNLAWGLLTARGVGWQEKIAAARWMRQLKAQGFRLQHDLSVAEWLAEAGQGGALRRHLWEPLCLAALNLPAKRASARIFANVLRDSLGSPHREDTDLLLPRVDFGTLLPAPAGAWLAARGARLCLATRVREIADAGDRVLVDGESFAAAIIACAPQHAVQLWPEIGESFSYEPIATVYLQFSAAFNLPFPLFQQSGKYGQWAVDRGNGLIACVLSGHGEWEALSDAALGTTLTDELGAGELPCWQRVIREKRATFSCQPGLIRPSWQTTHQRVLLAGDYTWAEYPATLEGAVRSGRRAANYLTINNIIQ